jgi:hypothetical protein
MNARSRRRVLGAAAVGVLLAAVVAGDRALQAPASVETKPVLSFFALGDAGEVPGLFPSLDSQRAVGRALEHEDRRAPVDALVFLGDNFYEHGLSRGDMVERLRANLVMPYCGLVELAGPRSSEVKDACSPSEPSRKKPPLYAVLGNHDAQSDESRVLQIREVPLTSRTGACPRKWPKSSSSGAASGPRALRLEIAARRRRPEPLRDALRAARGPWR